MSTMHTKDLVILNLLASLKALCEGIESVSGLINDHAVDSDLRRQWARVNRVSSECVTAIQLAECVAADEADAKQQGPQVPGVRRSEFDREKGVGRG